MWWLHSLELDMVTYCVVEQRGDGMWLLAVWQAHVLVVSEACACREVAVRLGNQIWAHFKACAWEEITRRETPPACHH